VTHRALPNFNKIGHAGVPRTKFGADTSICRPVPVAQWVKPLLIDHSACWPDGLKALAELSSNPGLEGGFQLDWTSGHVINDDPSVQGSCT